ncbi:RES family NAD+ phosphorylase [Tunicatimonas pelagia]|uniref:RES family NAD+ phosphorylase n=1 Tax=Tunicatimonas pelagia TaxID=931531 RepID=UPI00266659B5|nr:RES family NAD+ phosphorylase [Tunicatimonas pelagia]WKN42903.1 RES family NAD+ phosphorylase [Tunicatimonas pelagia]
MVVYRLVRRPYANQLDGRGAALFGGRWNSMGSPVIYTAQHRSLAVLEYRVNNPLPVPDLMMVSVEVPGNNVTQIAIADLPKDWASYSFESPCAHLGDQWVQSQETLLLQVPSVVVPQEHNILINPIHPQMKQVKVLDVLPFIIDARIYYPNDDE